MTFGEVRVGQLFWSPYSGTCYRKVAGEMTVTGLVCSCGNTHPLNAVEENWPETGRVHFCDDERVEVREDD